MIALTCYRPADWDTPLRVLSHRRAGRFNNPGSEPVQYLSLHPLTPWAELLRFEALTRADELAQLRLPIWALRVRLDAEPLELTFDNAPEHGLAAEALIADDHGPCRAFAARRDGKSPDALITPSAALPGTRNLVLFGPRVGIPYAAEPIDPQDVPLSVTALRGYAPVGLLESVHHRGAPHTHAGLVAWRESRELAWREPRPDPKHREIRRR